MLAAISHRGCTPLNYNLRNFLKTGEKNVIDLTTTSSTTGGNDEDYPPPLPLPHPNLSQGIGSYYLDKLLEEEWKSAGRIENFQQLKSKMKTREEKVEHLKKTQQNIKCSTRL